MSQQADDNQAIQADAAAPAAAPQIAALSALAQPALAAASEPGAPAPPKPVWGRRYGFLCGYCSSRLEAVESMAGQGGTCPTCGKTITIPILDRRGRLIDPESGKIIKQDPHPVHAYAAAGHRAPAIVSTAGKDERAIECPRCRRQNPLNGNNCLGCGLPFTMEGTTGEAVSGSNSWAVASLVLGIVGIPMCIFVPALLAVIFGFLGLRSTRGGVPQGGRGMAMSGMILGVIGLGIACVIWLRSYVAFF